MDARPPSDWRRSLGDAGPYLGLGMQLGLTVALFTGLGYGVDRWFGTLPWGTLVGAGVGITMLFVQLVRVSNELTRRGDRRRERARDAARRSKTAEGDGASAEAG